jgi:hypothetical protein
LFRCRKARFLFFSFILTSFVVGAISSYDRPPLTRLLVLSPFLALLTAVALERFSPCLFSKGGTAGKPAVVTALLLIFGIISWNLTAQHHSIVKVHHGYGDGTTSELIRETALLPDDTGIFYIQHDQTHMQCVDLVMDAFGYGSRFIWVRPYGNSVLGQLAARKPPFAVFCNLTDTQEIMRIKSVLYRRFPHLRWQFTDPGKPWSLRFFHVPRGAESAKTTSDRLNS